jgi:hypothetical protein
MPATINLGSALILAGACGIVLLWLLPSILVALRADTEGFRPWTFFLLALLLSWPVVLALVSIFGSNSPLVSSRQRDDEAVTRIEPGRGAS